jgi:hypothetical protein
MESDGFVSGTRGWQVDGIQITSGSEDCASDGVPDECVPDSDNDGTLDSCEECPLEAALLSPSEPGLEVTCNDGIDNDCDGLTDNTDWDCNGGCPFVCGDLDGSTTVNLADFATFAVCFNESPGISQACTCSDLNVDGLINLNDFATFAALFNLSPTNSPPNCP